MTENILPPIFDKIDPIKMEENPSNIPLPSNSPLKRNHEDIPPLETSPLPTKKQKLNEQDEEKIPKQNEKSQMKAQKELEKEKKEEERRKREEDKRLKQVILFQICSEFSLHLVSEFSLHLVHLIFVSL